MMGKKDYNLVQVVAEDLEYLLREWDQEIDDSSLRRSSGVLRRLLTEKDYGNAWRKLGFSNKQPQIVAPDSDKNIFRAGVTVNQIILASSGGAKYHGGIIENFRFVNFAMSEEQSKRSADPKVGNKVYKLDEYLKSAGIVTQGAIISRSELIQYVCNKLGGTHYDSSRNPNNDLDVKFSLLDAISNLNMSLLDKNIIYYELLSIGQCLAKSRDALKFVKRAKGTF